MSYKTDYKWNKENKTAMVKIEDKQGHIFLGVATCHPDDENFMSEHLGMEIAENRARLNMIRFIRDNETKPALKSLKHVFSNMKTSKNFNPKSYEAKMIRRQINILEQDLNAIKILIKDYNNYIKELIDSINTYKKITNK